MGDPNHLEKMGRELKCPICLSLLNSAVSLTCNHVFCNECILKSMKSDSTCPVCKVPYRPREVRAAPHMDNLVSIYKSMEIASGINIFVTQNAPPSTKSLAEEEKQVEGDLSYNGKICQDRAENNGASNRKRSMKTTNSKLETSCHLSAKPTFPTKKRVQVPLYPFSETPTRNTNSGDESIENNKDQFKTISVVSKENVIPTEKGQLILSPFFWLRGEEDAEKSSQHTDEDQIVYTTPPNVPCFSDIKDSDDEGPSSMVEVNDKPNIEDFFDSEMFEWTQRACSPELLSTPVKAQVEEIEEAQERKLEEVLQGTNTNEEPRTESTKCMDISHGSGTAYDTPSISSPTSRNSNHQIGSGNSKKRCRKPMRIAQKCAKRNADKTSEIQDDSKEEFVNFVEKQSNNSNGNSLNLVTRSMSKRTGFGGAPEPKSENDLFSVRPENREGYRSMVNMPVVLGTKQKGGEDLNLKKNKKECRINALLRDRDLGSKKPRLDSSKINVLEEISTNQKKTNNVIATVSTLSVPLDNDKNASNFKEIACNHGNKPAPSLKCNQETRCRKKMKVSFSGLLEDALVDDNQESNGNVSAKKTQPIKQVQGRAEFRVLDDQATLEKLSLRNGVTLRKCDTLPPKFQCAFCHSAEDSEVSGEMMHYYNGRSVASDYDGGSKAIHAHRGCTEWSPNVYFEDDIAINLEIELVRSRRIKCCCCGLKGAALGCYEKSCRKSFHVPCAKLTPQCRWDNDNFVMLCPLHSSSKLPNENSESQERRKRCMPRGQTVTNCNQLEKHDTTASWHWKSFGSPNKLVLCCSALTAGEREIVSEFTRLSGITVLKKWNSSVTHVIASIDENKACRRTLKVLMGILEGKWILNIEWVKASMQAMEPVDEEQYEITIDIHGIRGGPHLGRQRLQKKEPKLFEGLKFFLMGDFEPSYKGYLQDLVIAAGGSILQRKPTLRDQRALISGSTTSSTFVIYSLEVPDKCDPSKKNMIFDRRQCDAEAMASSTGAKAVSNSWVLNSIAACKLQSFAK
ncbi:BRCT domain-containing protein/zf-HC5HC2H domain-containing protein/zf-C3HC4_2 domain-containing protein [Cephalotus follicularis]|uniref:BRCT domain-containing protein/zf-HC5HC2H domain-containing protein/zf-C3HC4_2 domain-containing protein n=1 Tax=Cephalotus follicularis TaxID=3775 RepID=A0A1Q3C8P1_CEPFO|nr:BRCT domain-containing protein/zf-HC5HC2H domain-containing protein/zf-C3HC4_2 domain-containing protein [Cephalotus follicularis]